MARRLNWEKANSRDKAEKRHDPEHVTIAGAPDMDTIFGRKPTFMDRSGLTAKQRKKKRAPSPNAGAPDMETIFGRKPTFMERSGLTAKQSKKKRAPSPKALGSSSRFTKILCPECGT